MPENDGLGKVKMSERIRVGEIRPAARIIIQECRKCRIQTESDHLLVACPRRKPFCDGRMTGELDFPLAGMENKFLNKNQGKIKIMKRLMIVEDLKQIRDILCNKFSRNYKVIAPEQGSEVMKFFKEKRPDLVLLDYDLWPGFRGDEFLKLMKEEAPEIPIVIHTGWNEQGLKERLLAEGADAFIEKGCRIEKVMRALAEACQKLK